MGTFLWLITLLIAGYAAAQDPEACDKRNTFFRHNYEYEYRYTATTSSAFIGVSDSKSGSKISCDVTLKVPQKCNIIMEMSGCSLMERTGPGEEDYIDVPDSQGFAQELEMNAAYFQLNKGAIVAGSVKMSEADSLAVKNIKRGVMSAVQLHIREVEEYDQPVTQTDVFGTCDATYKLLLSPTSEKIVSTYRNLRECDLNQVFLKHTDFIIGGAKRRKGGRIRAPISEPIYPFVSEITCEHQLNNLKRLNRVDCLQQQYFRVLAYHGDILASAMANISQHLELVSTTRNRNIPDIVTVDMVPTSIEFDFAPDEVIDEWEPLLDQLLRATAALLQDYPKVPAESAELLDRFRKASSEALMRLMNNVFSCFGECDKLKVTQQMIYLDILESCGTDTCLEMYFHCMQEGHISRFRQTPFLMTLAQNTAIPDNIIIKMKEACDDTEKTSCWLALGTLVGHTDVTSDADMESGSGAWEVISHLRQTAVGPCSTGELTGTERQLVTLFKTLANIGYPVLKKFDDSNENANKILPLLETCLENGGVTTQVTKSILMASQTLRDKDETLPESTKDALFAIFTDVSKDMAVRSLALNRLMIDNNPATMTRIIDHYYAQDTKQMKSYLRSVLWTMLENDQPDQRQLRETWESVYRSSQRFPSRFRYFDTKYSQQVNLAHIFKMPISDYFGGQLFLDIVYDPAASVYRSLTISINAFHGETKNNIIELSTDIHGMDKLAAAFTGQGGLGVMDVYMQYKKMRAKMEEGGSEAFTSFQQNILDVVTKIMEKANYPVQPDYDFIFHLKMRGQNIHYWSLRELQQAFRAIRSQAGPDDPPMMEKILFKLGMGIQKSVFKVGEMMNIRKDLPTCVGLPMFLNVQVVGSGYHQASVSAEVMPFMAEVGPLKASLDFTIQYAIAAKGQLRIEVLGYHSSGIKASFQSKHKLEHGIYPSWTKTAPTAEIPVSYKLQFDFPNIKNDEEILTAGVGEMHLLHHTRTEQLQNDPAVAATLEKCSKPWFTAFTGRQLCMTVNYPDVKNSRTHAYFPLSGPFDFKLAFIKRDRSLEKYSVSWEYQLHNTTEGLESHLNFLHLAKGDTLERRLQESMIYNWKSHNFYYNAEIPEMDLVYKWEIERKYNSEISERQFRYVDFVWKDGRAWFGLIFTARKYVELEGEKEFDQRAATLNVTFGGASWELEVNKGSEVGGSDRDFRILFSYHIPKDHSIMHVLHIDQDLAEQNGDTTSLEISHSKRSTVISTDPFQSGAIVTNKVLYPGMALIVTDNRDWNLQAGHAITDISYTDGSGFERTIRIERNGQNNTNEESKQFNAVMTMNVASRGDVQVTAEAKASRTNMELTIDAEYTKHQDENVSRRKRSLTSIYNKFVELAAEDTSPEVDVDPQIESPVPESDNTEQTSSPDETPVESPPTNELPPLPDHPSIWEMDKWKSSVKMNGHFVPVFDPSTPPGQGPPVGIEFVWTGDITHPWQGGYRIYSMTGKAGKNRRNTIRDFKFWAEIQETVEFTTLDGDPMPEENVIGDVSVKRSSDFHIERGYNFDFGLHVQSPILNASYELVLDRMKDMARITSHLSNYMLPFFNHDFEETLKFGSNPNIFTHSLNFVHMLYECNVQTTTTRSRDGITLEQNGFIAYKFPRYTDSVNYTHLLTISGAPEIFKWVTTTIWNSDPDKIYSLVITDTNNRGIVVVSSQTENGSEEEMWRLLIEMWGATTIQYTLTWSPAYDEVIDKSLGSAYFTVGMALSKISAKMYSNSQKPWFFITLPIIRKSAAEIVVEHIAPRVVLIDRIRKHQSNNLIAREYRTDPYATTRLQLLKQAIEARKEDELKGLHFLFGRVRRLQSYFVKRLGQLFMVAGVHLAPKQQKLFQRREMVAAFPVPLVYDRLRDHSFIFSFSLRRHLPQLVPFLLFPYQRFRRSKTPLINTHSAASIFGRQGTDRPLNIRTFDMTSIEIPASSAAVCSYLLAAHISHRDYALIATPTGISFITKTFTASVEFNKHVYINKCKIPVLTASSASGDVTVSQDDDRIIINTQYGISITCLKTFSHVCTVVLEVGQKNQTLGLLGSNTGDSGIDMRKIDGTWATSISELLSEYVVSGPAESCTSHAPQPPIKSVCQENAHSYCYKYFNSYGSSLSSTCSYSSSAYMEVCRRGSERCDSLETDICHAVLAYRSLCETAGVRERDGIDNPSSVPCHQRLPSLEHPDHDIGSLDVVFVVSQHSTMAGSKEPWELITTLFSVKPKTIFETVRIGVVGFANNNVNPYKLTLQGKQFIDLADLSQNWNMLDTLTSSSQAETVDAFSAIEMAASFPFNPYAHKFIVVLTTKEQSSGDEDITSLREKLQSQDILINIFSTYRKLSSKNVLGVDWQGRLIRHNTDEEKIIDLPPNAYMKLVTGTKGAAWDIMTLKRGRLTRVKQILDHLVQEAEDGNHEMCA